MRGKKRRDISQDIKMGIGRDHHYSNRYGYNQRDCKIMIAKKSQEKWLRMHKKNIKSINSYSCYLKNAPNNQDYTVLYANIFWTKKFHLLMQVQGEV